MSRLRWWGMYLTSYSIGIVLGVVLLLLGHRFRTPTRQLVRGQAIVHADEAAAMRGPYLAPFTLLAALIMIVVFGALLINAIN